MRGAVLLLAAVLAGCASPGIAPSAPAGPQTVRVIGGTGQMTQIRTNPTELPRAIRLQVPHDRVWSALPAAYASLAIPVAHLDAGARVIGHPGFRARRRLGDVSLTQYFDCGNAQGGPSAETYELQISIFTEVQPSASGATLITTAQATARPVNFSGEAVQCATKGGIETRLADLVRAQAAG